MHSLNTVFDELTSRIEALRSGNESPDAVPSGMKDLDRILNGFQKGKLYVVAGRPSMGTTTFMVNLVHNMLLKSAPAKKVAVFLLDQSAPVFLERLLSCTTGIWLEKFIRGKFEDHEWKKAKQQGINRLLSTPLSIDDEAPLSVIDIAEKCENLINRNGLDIIFIDNLQLIKTAEGLKPDEEIAKAMRNLRDLARTRNIPIVLLSRWEIVVKNKSGRRRPPQLSDMQDTGPIGQEADALLFLHRPEYYDIIEDESGESLRDATYVKIAKNRMGNLDTIRLKAQLHIQKMEDYVYIDPFAYEKPAKQTRRSDKKSEQNGTLFDKEIPDEPF